MPIEAIAQGVRGAEWSVGGLEGDLEAGRVGGGGEGGGAFGSLLSKQINSLNELQSGAAEASQAVATGQASDPTAAIMAVERARLSMQLATSVRTKLTEAFSEVMRTQV